MPTWPATCWLTTSIGFTENVIRPTLIRLPGYPAFLALCFTLFGSRELSGRPVGAGCC
jgi:hypothetical protein